MRKKLSVLLALAGLFIFSHAQAISLDDVQYWTGSGTNRAALIIEWSSPEVFSNTVVPAPVADKTMVWGYRFNGAATATEMLDAIVAADPRLYVVENNSFGTYVVGIGYNLNGNGNIGVTDGIATNFFTSDFLTNATVNVDAAHPINPGDLYWSGWNGPNWEVWNEAGDAGGFLNSPNRGTNSYWTPGDTNAPYYGVQGQWEYAQAGLDDLPLTNGSWIGFTVAAGAYDYLDSSDPSTIAYNFHKHAPPSPDGTYTAYVCDTNDFAGQVVSTNNVFATSPYNDPAAVLNRPTLKFVDGLGTGTTNRTKIIESPYWKAPDGSNVITEISSGGQITLKMGRKIYDDPNNPYGVDFIVYGNSFFSASGFSGAISDGTDLNTATLGSGIYGHPTIVSVSQDGVNWYSYGTTSVLFPDNAYRWDDSNAAWTGEQMNPTKPLNPSVYAMNFSGQSVASGLDQFVGAAGGSGYDLKASGLPWIQYVRIQPGAGTYTVIDAIAAVNPVVVGGALSITPDDIASNRPNLFFQKPDDLGQTLIALHFDSVSSIAKVSTIELSDFSSFAPVPGDVSSAYQVTLRPVTGNNAVTFQADVGLRASENYSGDGSDLHVYEWGGSNWISQPFTFNSTNDEATIAGATNLSAFVVSQIIPPQLSIQPGTNGFVFQFSPVPDCANVLERSTNLVTWTSIATNTPASALPVTLQDEAAPMNKAYYRIRVDIP